MESNSRFSLPLVAASLLALPVAGTHADYTCHQLDVPGSTWTQLWQLNGTGMVAAGSSLGARLYSGGGWLALPPLPPGAPVSDLGALGINDSGVVVGPGTPASGAPEVGFILSGGTYTFFSYPGGTYSSTEPRAIGNNGVVTGLAHDGSTAGVGFAYNPGTAREYASGFTEVVPTLPSGTRAWRTIPGAMNGRGQFVGSADFIPGGRYGFLYDPNAASAISLFRINGAYTASRGINNLGYVVGFTLDTAQTAIVGYLLTDQGYQYVTCPTLPGATGVYPESINDSGVITGIWFDAAAVAHGFIAYPSVVLPVASSGGAFTFDVAVSPNTPVFLDPAPAVGYRYAVGRRNPLFTSVILPIGIGDSVYTLLVSGTAFTLAGGQRFDFAANGFRGGVAAFEVLGIEPAAQLDPASPTAFVTEVTFGAGGGGRFTGTMTPMTIADELADLRAAVARAPHAGGISEEAREAQAAYAVGNISEACEALGGLVAKLGARPACHMGQALARTLAAEAQAIEDALGCQPQASSRDDDRGRRGEKACQEEVGRR